MSMAKPLNVHTRISFVRAGVKETTTTRKIIDTIFPFFPKQCRCIAGYLDNSDQFWKVNYHWDLLTHMIDQFIALKSTPQNLRTCAQAIKSALSANRPNPPTGYRTDKVVGFTKDTSTAEQIIKRHGVIKQSKRDFESVLIKAKVVNAASKSNPPQAEKPWWLAVAPVALPGMSNHGTGYALDIEGNNIETTRIAKMLGASLVYNEASHVHVEWKNGVKLS